MRALFLLLPIIAFLSFTACSTDNTAKPQNSENTHEDKPFVQKYSIKYNADEAEALTKVFSDRNGNIQIMGPEGLLKPFDGAFLYPGTLVPDHSYRALDRKTLRGLDVYEDQFMYLSDEAVFSNSWAGAKYIEHELPDADRLCMGTNFDFIISNGRSLQYYKDGNLSWEQNLSAPLKDIKFQNTEDVFWILTENTLNRFTPSDLSFEAVYSGTDLSAFALSADKLYIAEGDGYLETDHGNSPDPFEKITAIPSSPITYMQDIGGTLWFGSEMGAFSLRGDGKYNYYLGQRWLPGSRVKHISKGPENSILILTPEGLGQILEQEITLAEKAAYYEEQVRKRHIRYGFNATLGGLDHGNLATGSLADSDNDGLWTAMYLAGQAFRYAVTNSGEALANCRESMDAMNRLFSVNPVKGFPSRSFERSGDIENLADPDRWQHGSDPEWDWKATTSSDEAIGHIFAYAVVAELMADTELKETAITLIDSLMTHVVDNDLYLIDYDGKHTTWGRWNPEYVNARPKMVGDRKLNSSNIIAMLQTAYHFTQNEKYKDKAFELMIEHGYLENLLRPISEIGPAPETADDWSKMLSEEWNHSDDEMYFLGYWGLYEYAFNDTLKAQYKEAIIDHWEAERPEKEGLWNIFTAITGPDDFDLDEGVWYLQEYPLDLINWDVQNSHRKDLQFLEANFRNQTTAEVLPPGERPIRRHNGNTFGLDRVGGNGNSESSAGDIWLLPYWMGRYLGVIGPEL